ncbi:LysR family transcriptional regulator [Neiella marina]|uniref:LysR family transcriptional regulator n=1 Tax=Neiella holothuriorum TaxID=2870530 RepID=A0ABS7EF99_9GAMM|nr:LysR family transcriptional regulator [Neiella holothuriorum]MBW8190920.1 LysR family transcriptional regulator [Neiella holothuriorum]
MKLEDMELFVVVAELGSFTKAGDYCDIPKSTVSRRVKELEDSLKVRLLNRTTRALHLTQQGEVFYQRAKTILEDISRIQNEVADEQATASGRITVYAPSLLFHVFARWMTEFRKKFPNISLELLSRDDNAPLGDDKRFDLLIQAGQLQDSSFIAKKLGDIPGGYFASPSYLAEAGTPSKPEDLTEHNILFRELVHGEEPEWHFYDDQGEHVVRLEPSIITDSPQGLLALTCHGGGIARLSKVHAKPLVDEGKLVSLFDDRYQLAIPLYALYPSRRYMPERVRLLLQYLESELPKAVAQLVR